MGLELVADSMVGQLPGISKRSKLRLSKITGINIDWSWFLPCVRVSIAKSNGGVKNVNYMASGREDLTTGPDKRVNSASSSWSKKGNIIDRLDESKKIDVVYSKNKGKKTLFRPGKNFRVADGSMALLGASAILDKKVRVNANYSPNRKRGPSFKPKRGLGVLGSLAIGEAS